MFDVTDYATPQDAINAAQTAGGGKVYFPAGTYAPVVVSESYIFLVGDGPRSMIVAAGGPAISITGTPGVYVRKVVVRDLRVYGNGTGILFEHCINCSIENCSVLDMASHGIDIGTFSWSINIVNSWITFSAGDGIRVRNDSIQVISIRGCTISFNDGHGIYYQRSVGCSVMGSTIEGNKLPGIEADDDLRGLCVMGNYFEKNNQVGGSEGPQVKITASGPDKAQGFVFIGNYMQGTDGSTQGLFANAGEYGIVAGNCMRRHTDRPLEIVEPAFAWLVSQGPSMGTPNLPLVSYGAAADCVGRPALMAGIPSVVTVASSHTVRLGEQVILASGAGTVITLPEDAPANTQFTIKRNDAVNAILVQCTGSDTIDNKASLTLHSKLECVIVVSDGGNWHIIGTNLR